MSDERHDRSGGDERDLTRDSGRSERRRRELATGGDHSLPEAPPRPAYTAGVDILRRVPTTIYAFADLTWVQAMSPPQASYTVRMKSLDDLMERDARGVRLTAAGQMLLEVADQVLSAMRAGFGGHLPLPGAGLVKHVQYTFQTT